MVVAIHPYFEPSQAAAFNELAAKKDSTFEFRYFGLHGFGAPIRAILAINDAKFVNVVPGEKWATMEKALAPFGVMPLLKEISADGKTVINIAESEAIERYLTKKFGMAGDNAFEETVVDSFVCSTGALIVQIFLKYFTVKDPALKAAAKEQLVSETIATWIKLHEHHLVANGSNGHYVGNKTTHPDIKTAQLIDIINGVQEGTITEESNPALWKVKTSVESIPGLKAWKATEEFKAQSELNLRTLGY
ncbi:Glutathione S-transferase S1 [Entomortierella lignicola]|nr:Glutathione S-transferase S1 [Entomortierella lignicola]